MLELARLGGLARRELMSLSKSNLQEWRVTGSRRGADDPEVTDDMRGGTV
jgi:hypothetical protein